MQNQLNATYTVNNQQDLKGTWLQLTEKELVCVCVCVHVCITGNLSALTPPLPSRLTPHVTVQSV